MDGRKKRWQFVRNCLFHLITREAARDENMIEKFIRVDLPRAGKSRKRMHIETVAAVNHGNRISMNHRVRGHLERQLKNSPLTVQQKYFAWLVCSRRDGFPKSMNHPLRANGNRILMDVYCWLRSGISAVMLGGRYRSRFAHDSKKEYDIFVVLSRSDSSAACCCFLLYYKAIDNMG
jgi:hypothetical protein